MDDTAPGRKILVVDDEVKACTNMKTFLEKKQFSVMEAYSGGEAVTKIFKFKPDIIIMDIIMPGLPGDELIKVVKGWRPDIKIIVVTAVIDPDSQQKFREYGAFAVIQKPVYFKQILELLNEIFESKEKVT